MDGMGMSMLMHSYLHFTGGDALWFAAWTPTSHGAIAGSCIGLVLLAIFERLLVAVRGTLDAMWVRRARMACEAGNSSYHFPVSEKRNPPSIELSQLTPTASNTRRITFIPAHDIQRGVVFLVQSSIGFALMLTVMTMNASYIISIILGLGIGETLFGRFAATTGPHV